MHSPEALASMRQENLSTLRATIETVKQEAKNDGAARTIGRALDIIELVLRAQEQRLREIEAAALAAAEAAKVDLSRLNKAP